MRPVVALSTSMIYRSIFFLFGVLSPALVLAGDFGLGETADHAGLRQYGGSLEASIGTVVGALLSLIGVIFFIMIIYGGIMWMTSAGNQDTVKKSINTVISAAIGLIVVLSAYAITSFVLDSVGPSAGGPAPAPETAPIIFGGAGDACTIDDDCGFGFICGDDEICIDDPAPVE